MHRLVIGLLALTVLVGCEARSQVARDKILDKIDSWLGKLDVKQKQVENELNQLKSAVADISSKKIKAKVHIEQYEERVAKIENEIERNKNGLKVLSPYLQTTEDVEVQGKTYTPQQIRDMANKVADNHDALQEKLGGYKATMKAFQQSYDLLSAQQSNFDASIMKMDQQLDQIKAKKEAIEGMQTAQTILGDGGSISDKFTNLESEINDLFIDVEAGVRVETEKIAERERDLNSRSADIDSILQDIESVDSTASRINAILGEGPEAEGGTDKESGTDKQGGTDQEGGTDNP